MTNQSLRMRVFRDAVLEGETGLYIYFRRLTGKNASNLELRLLPRLLAQFNLHFNFSTTLTWRETFSEKP